MVKSSSSFRSPQFQTTRWTIIARAANDDPAEKREAMQSLCEIYWPPVYTFVRRRGFDRHEAEELTQDFFAGLIQRDMLLTTANQSNGRFRTYLLAAVKHHLANHRRSKAAQKRGGDVQTLSIDWNDAERRYVAEPIDGWTAEAIFHRQWALTLLARVLDQLREGYAESGREPWFQAMSPFLTGEAKPNYDQLSQQLQTTPAAARVAVHRLRKQYRTALAAEISGTISDTDAVNEERVTLLKALSGDVD
jgi:RNA polymerase sigma-70 factor (ECF subfamily)